MGYMGIEVYLNDNAKDFLEEVMLFASTILKSNDEKLAYAELKLNNGYMLFEKDEKEMILNAINDELNIKWNDEETTMNRKDVLLDLKDRVEQRDIYDIN